MIVHDIRKESTAEGTELSAEVIFESMPDFRRRVWFRADPGLSVTDTPGNVFFAGFFIPAMALGEDLRVEAEVEADLLEAAIEGIRPVQLRWFPDFRPSAIETAGTLPPAKERAEGVACTFSGGLDSWYTFLKNRDEVTHVLHCRGFDRPHSMTARTYFDTTGQRNRRVTERHGKIYLGAESNLTDVGSRSVMKIRNSRGKPVDPTFQTDAYFGSQLVAMGHFFSPHIGKLYLASSYPYEHIFRTGSNPLLDPRWSTARLQVRHDGAEADRTEKMEYVVRNYPEALADMHVCHLMGSQGENCNICEKCVRTRVSMLLIGALQHSPSFRYPLELDEIRYLYLKPGSEVYWTGLLEAARERGREDIAGAIEVVLRRRFDLKCARMDFRVWLNRMKTTEGRRKFRRRVRQEMRQRRARLLSSL